MPTLTTTFTESGTIQGEDFSLSKTYTYDINSIFHAKLLVQIGSDVYYYKNEGGINSKGYVHNEKPLYGRITNVSTSGSMILHFNNNSGTADYNKTLYIKLYNGESIIFNGTGFYFGSENDYSNLYGYMGEGIYYPDSIRVVAAAANSYIELFLAYAN